MCLQDYNSEVLTKLTIPNCVCNLETKPAEWAVDKHLRFFFGGWSSLGDLLSSLNLSGTYDYIFSSDSIYSLDSQNHLLDCIIKVRDPISNFRASASKMTIMC